MISCLVVTVGGWAAAGLALPAAVVAWRRLEGRTEAVARACHELRGPLAAARLGLAPGLGQDEVSPERLRLVDLELERAAQALEDMPGGGSGVRRWEKIDVEGLLRDAVQRCQARAIDVCLGWNGPTTCVSGDPVRLAQAVCNLIANAAEHGAGAIEVRGRLDAGVARIEVVDEGPGLPAPVASLARRARGGRSRGARGRGLAIALAAVEAHGGRLAAAPSERGARLVMELPLSGAGEESRLA